MNRLEKSDQPLPQRIGLIGTGMIGTSVLLALKTRGHIFSSTAFDHNTDCLQKANQACAFDRCAQSSQQVVANSDIVLIATPPRSLQDIFSQLGDIPEDTLITDVASVKRSVCNAAHQQLKDACPQFIPGHPIAGSERNGPQFADADLFQDRNVVLTPMSDNDPQAVQKVVDLWYATGAKNLITLSAEDHDRIFAYNSHFPHILAYIYVHSLAGKMPLEDILEYSGEGLRDFARIAASDPDLWCDIFMSNTDQLMTVLRTFNASSNQLRNLLRESDRKGLHDFCQRAAEVQIKINAQHK